MAIDFKSENLTLNGPSIEVLEVVMLKAGEKVKRGEVLAKDGDEYVSWSSGAEAMRIAYEDADATDASVVFAVFKGGNFNFNGLTLPDGTEASAVSDTLWMNNIHIETNISGGA